MEKLAKQRRKISFSPPDISEAEIAEVSEALRSGWITTGPRTKLLERRLASFVDSGRVDIDCSDDREKIYQNRVVCLSSATAAEELNLRILGIGPGDEVIVPAYTYTATASAAIHCGATVRFVDIQKNGNTETHMPEMDYTKLAEAITSNTKAIVAVEIGGIGCDFDRIFEIVENTKGSYKAKDKNGTELDCFSSKIQQGLGRIAVLSDSAHSLGASRLFRGQKTYSGNIADFTSFSFHAVKNFTTAEGGASIWHLPQTVYNQGITNEEIYRTYQLLSLHGQDKDALAKTELGAWEYDIIGPWYKCNMTDIMAAIGLRQLDRYPELLKRRAAIIRQYDKVCDELGIFHLNHYTPKIESSGHLYLIRIPGAGEEMRNQFILKMAENGIATNVHYKPLPMMTAYKEMAGGIKSYPNSYEYYCNLVSLPLHTLLSDDDVNYILEKMRRVWSELFL